MRSALILTLFVTGCGNDKSGIDGDTAQQTQVTATSAVDADADGHSVTVDCDDTDPDIHPNATEICDGTDNNCDGDIDDADPDLELASAQTWYLDYDEDGYGGSRYSVTACTQPSGFTADADDCDDTDTEVNPEGTETCNGSDDDCDGLVDEELQGRDQSCPADSCAQLISSWPAAPSGPAWISPDGFSPIEVLCEMDSYKGGWTLLATNDWTADFWSPDTVANSTLHGQFSDTEDHKSGAFSRLPFTDLMFMNDDMAAVYSGVGDGEVSYHVFQDAVPMHNCGADEGWSWPMTEGDLDTKFLCDTSLYMHPFDWDGIKCSDDENGFGPTWSVNDNSGCPLDDPYDSGFWAVSKESSSKTHPWGNASPLRLYAR